LFSFCWRFALIVKRSRQFLDLGALRDVALSDRRRYSVLNKASAFIGQTFKLRLRSSTTFCASE
jgi:hypothetical protein